VKKAYLLALVLFAACRLPHRQPFTLDAHVTVELPHHPYLRDAYKNKRLKHPERIKIWVLRTLGGTYYLLRVVHPGLHITTHDTLAREAYYDRKIEELEVRKAQILSSCSFTVAGMKGRDITYKSRATATPEVVYSRSFVLDSVSYVLDFFPASQIKKGLVGFAENEQRQRFFNSMTVKP
jgi:hypothetical protein